MGGPEGRGQGQLARELGRKGAPNRGATDSNAELREAWRRLEVAFPCTVGARPKAAGLPWGQVRQGPELKVPVFFFGKPARIPHPLAGLMLLRVRLWKPRGRARQDPAREAQTERPGDQAGTWSRRAGCPLLRPVVEKGEAGASDSDPLRSALNASLEPDRGSGCWSRASLAALRRVPTCWLQGTKPRARLVRMAPALGPLGARAARRRGGRTADGESGRAAVGTSLLPAVRSAPGAARGAAKEKVSPGPGQPCRGIGPFGARGCRGQRVREGRSQAKRDRAKGSTAASGDPAAGGAGTGRPERTARITEERRPPRGAPLGNKLHEHSFERRKKSLHVASPPAAAVLPLLPGSRVGAGPRPLLRPLPGSGSPSSEPGWRTPKAVL